MPRLYDIVRGMNLAVTLDNSELLTVPKHLPVFDISGTHDFLLQALDDWDVSKLCICPPFPQFWMEYDTADKTNGAWFRCWSKDEWLSTCHEYSQSDTEAMAEEERLLAPARWVITADVFRSLCDQPGIAQPSRYGFGSMIDYHGAPLCHGVNCRSFHFEDTREIVSDSQILSFLVGVLYPMWFSMSHVGDRKNLKEIVPTRQQRRFS